MNDDIKKLIVELNAIQPNYNYEAKEIGRAITYLQMLSTILKENDVEYKVDIGAEEHKR